VQSGCGGTSLPPAPDISVNRWVLIPGGAQFVDGLLQSGGLVRSMRGLGLLVSLTPTRGLAAGPAGPPMPCQSCGERW